jgi:hypothetical protein
VLEAVLGENMDLLERQISSVEEFVKAFPRVKKLIIDAAERPRTRPRRPDKQRQHY